MTVVPGTRLGPYEIVAPIGAGGMGEVYKARDTRLERSVAIKILPPEFAQNAHLKIRFEREAKAISQLSHPHICTLYDVGENYLVMELLEGETIAERLSRGPLPLTDVLKFGIQISEALGRAHRAGIVHRDLKPANVMLTRSGAKLLDFGLAKTGKQVIDLDGLTAQKSLTQEGTILGTFQYMAPEQLEGDEADQRTDIFALGLVLYEMVTGKRAFEGKTKTSLIAAIVSGEPKQISAIQPLTPPALEHVIKKCLEKDPEARWQSASDVAEELRWITQGEPAQAKRRTTRWPLVGATVLAVAIGAAIGGYVVARARPAQRLVSTEINPPEGATFEFDAGAAVLSPDGSKIAFVAKPKGGAPLLWVKPLDSPTALPLKSTENASFAFWSPDSKSLAFFADGKLKRIDAAGGSPETLADAAGGRGGSWSKDNVIVFSPLPPSPLFQVAAGGGKARPVTTLESQRGQTSHRFPTFLPDGRHFLAYVQGTTEGPNILLGSLDSKESRLILRADTGVIFAAPDFVLFVRSGTLRAQRIDLKTFALVGDPVSLAEGVQTSSALQFASVSASSDGLLAYTRGESATFSTLQLLDRSGKEVGTVGTAADQLDPRMAPDGHAVIVSRSDRGGTLDIWSIDLRRNIETRLTFSPANEWSPVWSPDSKSVVYTSFENRPGDLFIKCVEGSGAGEPLLVDKRLKIASDWSSDGRYVIYHALSPLSRWDIEAYSVPEKKIIPLLNGTFSEIGGHLSPDGRWLAYASDASGRDEVYVQRFPVATEKSQISGGGGYMPTWSRDGRELYYYTIEGKMMAATVHADRDFVADAPRLLFQSRLRGFVGITRNQYDVTPDKRFLINVTSPGKETTASITLVQNWRQKLGR